MATKKGLPTFVDTKRIVVHLTDGQFKHLRQMASKHNTSMTFLTRMAVMNMLIEDNEGEFTLIPEFQKWAHVYNA